MVWLQVRKYPNESTCLKKKKKKRNIMRNSECKSFIIDHEGKSINSFFLVLQFTPTLIHECSLYRKLYDSTFVEVTIMREKYMGLTPIGMYHSKYPPLMTTVIFPQKRDLGPFWMYISKRSLTLVVSPTPPQFPSADLFCKYSVIC